MDGTIPILAATIAFGMGVDRSAVRFVVHWCPPQSLCAYAQESGRAGRDGNQAAARIYYGRKDRDIVLGQVSEDAAGQFQRVIKYCESIKCRHEAISVYFADEKPNCHGNCDVCKDKQEVRDRVDKFVSSDQRFGDLHQVANAEFTAILCNKFYMKK